MMKGFWVALVILACPLLWITIIVPLVANCFGVEHQIGILPFDRRNQQLGKWQTFWFAGVLGWGVCVFLVGALIQFSGEFSKTPTIPQLVFELALCCLSGGMLSLWNYPRRSS